MTLALRRRPLQFCRCCQRYWWDELRTVEQLTVMEANSIDVRHFAEGSLSFFLLNYQLQRLQLRNLRFQLIQSRAFEGERLGKRRVFCCQRVFHFDLIIKNKRITYKYVTLYTVR